MPFFLIVPLWVLALIAGVIMLFTRSTRRAGIYVLTIATSATVVSFALSTAVLFLGAQASPQEPSWIGIVIIGAYLAAIPIGGLVGAIVGLLVTRKVLS